MVTGGSQHLNSLFFPDTDRAGGYNEAFAESGEARSHWLPLLEHFQERTGSQLQTGCEKAGHMRHEDGAIINPFDDVHAPSTSWDLDIIPFPITAQEWDALEKGIGQRAKLLEKILADVYSHQELLTGGKIPPELIFANPNFLLPCHGIKPSGGRYLSFYGVDLYRGPDGRFRILRDYGSVPVGLGYSLENRIIMSRLFPNLYHRTRIRRLALFFKNFHRSLICRASLAKNDPGIVVFSPGPNSPHYFEHALLSRYLGYTLVESQDLTVRDGKIFLKKLAGLEPVNAIFRHIGDQESDPFALRHTTAEGVAGLIQVCREENIDIINPVGAGFIETPLLNIFLPELCRYFLGEDLLLDNHPLWHCNSPEGQFCLTHPEPGSFAVEAIGSGERHELSPEYIRRIESSPQDYLVASSLQPSVLPECSGQTTVNRHVMLRLFACASDDGFAVMPGGIAITGSDVQQLLANGPDRQKSKDIWVVSDEPVVPVTLLDGFDAIPEFKRGSDLPSRVADNLLWLGRYLERAESRVRLLRPAFQFLLGEDRPEDIVELQFLVNVLQGLHVIEKNEGEGDAPGNCYTCLPDQLSRALLDRNSVESIATLLKRVLEIARNVRDRLSIDSFRILHRLEDFSEYVNDDPLDLLDRILFTLNGFSGMAMETITREIGWRFLDMGRRLERAMSQSALISTSLVLFDAESPATHQPMLQLLLEISHSLMTYRGRYRSSFQLAPVLDLLLLDETNPRSLSFQIRQIAEHVDYLPRPGVIKFASLEEKIALEMLSSVRLLDLNGVDSKSLQTEKSLLSFFDSLDRLLAGFSEQITAHYLSRVPSTPHYGISQRRSTLI